MEELVDVEFESIRIPEPNKLIIITPDGSEVERRWQHKSRSESWTDEMRQTASENAHTALDQDEYQTRYDALLARYETAKNRLDEITEEKQSRAAKRECISRFISDLERCDGLLTEFDEALWYETIETLTVHSESDVAVAFKDGSEVHVDVSEK